MIDTKGKLLGSQNRSNIKKAGPKVMIDKQRASKSKLNLPKQQEVTRGERFDSAMNASQCSGQNCVQIKKKLYHGEHLKLENLFVESHSNRRHRRNSSQIGVNSTFTQNLPSKAHHGKQNQRLASRFQDANDQGTKVRFEMPEVENHIAINEIQEPIWADRAPAMGLKITITNFDEQQSLQKEIEQHEVKSCQTESYLEDSRFDFLENQFKGQDTNKEIDSSISMNGQQSFY